MLLIIEVLSERSKCAKFQGLCCMLLVCQLELKLLPRSSLSQHQAAAAEHVYSSLYSVIAWAESTGPDFTPWQIALAFKIYLKMALSENALNFRTLELSTSPCLLCLLDDFYQYCSFKVCLYAINFQFYISSPAVFPEMQMCAYRFLLDTFAWSPNGPLNLNTFKTQELHYAS